MTKGMDVEEYFVCKKKVKQKFYAFFNKYNIISCEVVKIKLGEIAKESYYYTKNGMLLMGDCLEWMAKFPDKCISMILCDLPYGTTASSWDKIIDIKSLWQEYERVIKDTGAIVLTANGQFTHKLISSNETLYKYKWIWVKTKKGNFVNAKNRPMTNFEEVLVFSKANTANGSKIKMNYYPQGLEECGKVFKSGENRFGSMAGKRPSHKAETVREFTGYPCDVLYFDSVGSPEHPTQKPVDLFEYLIKTYTNENEIVLDNTAGVLTTAVAAENTNRRWICIEKEQEYCDKGVVRLKSLKTEAS
jgi:site-specific DNA-methyltransferase (adenine-specific)